MLTLNGVCKNVFLTPEGVNKQGEKYGGAYKVQVEIENELRNGQRRFDYVDLFTDEEKYFEQAIGREVSVPVGAYVNQVGRITFYLRKGVKDALQAA